MLPPKSTTHCLCPVTASRPYSLLLYAPQTTSCRSSITTAEALMVPSHSNLQQVTPNCKLKAKKDPAYVPIYTSWCFMLIAAHASIRSSSVTRQTSCPAASTSKQTSWPECEPTIAQDEQIEPLRSQCCTMRGDASMHLFRSTCHTRRNSHGKHDDGGPDVISFADETGIVKHIGR